MGGNAKSVGLSTAYPSAVFRSAPRSNEILMEDNMKPKRTPEPAPEHLAKSTRAWWESVVENWHLEDHHKRLLTLAGEAWDRAEQAREAIAEHGMTFVDRFDQPRARPEIAIERDSRLAFARLLRELCLDENEPEPPRPPRAGGAKW